MCRPDFAPMKDAQIPLLLLLLTGAAFPCSTFITSDMWRHKPSNRVKVRQIWWIFSPILEQQHGNPAELHPWENVIGNSWLSLCLTLLSHILLFALSACVLLLLFASPFFVQFGAFLSSSFLHAALLNLSCLFASFLLSAALPSFSLLVSQLQMSNPSTPPQAVRAIVYKCDVCVCVCACVSFCACTRKESWRKCARLCACMSL